jgi:hypothetical protein
MQRSGIVAIGSTNVITMEDGNKGLEFAAVDKRDKREARSKTESTEVLVAEGATSSGTGLGKTASKEN